MTCDVHVIFDALQEIEESASERNNSRAVDAAYERAESGRRWIWRAEQIESAAREVLAKYAVFSRETEYLDEAQDRFEHAIESLRCVVGK